VVALLPFVLEIQRRAKQAHYPAPVFSGAGICDLEDFFIGSRKACAWLAPVFLGWPFLSRCSHVSLVCIHRAAGIKATPKPTAFPVVVVQQQFPITSRRHEPAAMHFNRQQSMPLTSLTFNSAASRCSPPEASLEDPCGMSPTQTAPVPLDHSALPRTAPYPFIFPSPPHARVCC
jgi:hypothetical protein